MKMDDMNKYLEDRGFEVKRTYIATSGSYEFTIRKGNNFSASLYKFNPTENYYARRERQMRFLNDLIEEFNKRFNRLSNFEFSKLINEFAAYCKYDVESTKQILNSIYEHRLNKLPKIEKVIFNPPATIVFWSDDTKTVVKTQNNELYDPEKGLAMAITKKALGNTRDYYIVFKKWTDKGIMHDWCQTTSCMKRFHVKRIQTTNDAYTILNDALNNKKVTKSELIEAMCSARDFLREVTTD